MDKYILPFELDVEMRAYHNRAFPLGVFKANIADYDKWLCGKLINFVMCEDIVFNALPEDIWSTNEGLTFKQSITLAPLDFGLNGLNIVDFNKSMLKKNYYITGQYNEFYIPQKIPYGKHDMNHDYLIFGYDDENMVFKSAAYLEDQTYGFFDINYDDYYKSVTGNKIPKTWVYYFRINQEYVVEIEIDTIKKKLEDYLYSRNTQGMPGNYICGLDAYQQLANYVSKRSSSYLDPRFGRAYMEHHGIMHKRIQKLCELSYINRTDLPEDYYQNVYLKTRIVHNMFMKFNHSNDPTILPRIVRLINEVNYHERSLIAAVIDNIALD